MDDAERYRLLHGPYLAPPFQYGDVVIDGRRGQVGLVGLSGGRIPWPLGKRRRDTPPALFGGLARAVRCESSQAVAHRFGVSVWLIWSWRKALGVPRTNEGTSRLPSDYALEPAGTAAREKAHARNHDPTRRAKIPEAKKGKARPAHVLEAMRRGRTGKPQSKETCRKMSEAHRRRGTRPPKAGRPWTAEQDELVKTLPTAKAASMTGRTPKAVWKRRRLLRMPGGRTRAARKGGRP